ncbi:protein maelstrom homolog [Parasteatoda tepidariorum]|uniref:protein maelstrom homolog n=1 Tax=Parasteatoda tepidariorum TaxID=114398 RepID=UPI0039BD6C46
MAPKNKKKNSFYFFMKEMQETEAAKGIRITMENMPQIAHPIWARLSVAEKQPYEKLAEKHKNDPCLRGGKLASDGTRVELNYSNLMFFITYIFLEFTSRRPFYFIAFNLMCKTETHYYPNEVGLVEYSIKNGIHREYHKIIYPGRIPTGYAGEAKRLSEVHEIDIYGESCSERNLKKVYDEIKEFTNPDNSDEYPPLFCIDEMIEGNYGCLDFLADVSREKNWFDIWDATNLLVSLRGGADAEIQAPIARDLLTKTSFNYHPSARCEFHEDKDNHNCALAYCKRLCYLLSDAVCLQYDVEITESHMPAISSEDKPYTVIISNDPPKLSRNNYNPPLPLDSRSTYYSGTESEVDQFSDIQSDIQSVVSSSVTSGHRQPASTCMSAQMARLRLNMTPATAPGHGIGRGQKRD